MSESYKYPWAIAVLAYVGTGLCSAGTFHLGARGMALVVLSCVVQGVVMVAISGKDWPVYPKRLLGSLLPSVFILLMYRLIGPEEGIYTIMSSMFMPIASGTTLVQGICHSNSKSGRHMVLEGILIGLMLELGAFRRLRIGGLIGWTF